MSDVAYRPKSGITRRTLLAAIALAPSALAITACNRRRTTDTTEQTPISLDAFPAGLGRGFPKAQRVAGNGNTGLRQGDLPPNFRLTLAGGQGLTIHDLMGRPVMLNFWATWCGPCRLEMPDIIQQAASHDELVVIAVNVGEELATVQAFAADYQMTMPVALDTSGDISDLYSVRGMPTSFFVGRNGKIAAVWAGLLTPDKLQQHLNMVI